MNLSAGKAAAFFDRGLRMVLTAALFALMPVSTRASESMDEVQLLKGDMIVIETRALTRVSITDPGVADISNATAEGVTVIGKELGHTVLFVWDGDTKITTGISVVADNINFISRRVNDLLTSADITEVVVTENANEGKVVLTGMLSADKKLVMEKALESLSGKYIDLVKEDVSEDMVQIDMQVTELSTTLTKELGVDWLTGSQSMDFQTGQVTTTLSQGFNPIGGEIVPPQDGSVLDMFKIGNWYRSSNSALLAKVNALITEGRGHVLSKPRLVVMSGKQATFLVGGEVPIVKTTIEGEGGATTESIDYKKYGVNLIMSPTVRNGKVDLVMNVQLSDIDRANSRGEDVGFTTRTAQTQLYLDDKQTIVLAGLIKKSDGVVTRKIPLMGSIPVLGMLFRSKKNPAPNSDSEVVISLTPTIIGTATASQGRKPFQPRDRADMSRGERDVTRAYAHIAPDIAPYARLVQEKISTFIAYPYEARKNGWQGVVKLAMVVRRDGTLRDAFIRQSSGYDAFDQDALNTARGLSPYAPIPSSILSDEVSLTIPISYQLSSEYKTKY